MQILREVLHRNDHLATSMKMENIAFIHRLTYSVLGYFYQPRRFMNSKQLVLVHNQHENRFVCGTPRRTKKTQICIQ